MNRGELISELNGIHSEGKQFFSDSSDALEGVSCSQPIGRSYERDEFWDKLPEHLQKTASLLISKLIQIVPIIAETAQMTPYLTQTDQIDLGHAIKGLRSALHLCRYRYWNIDVIHDEGTVLGVHPAGQTDNEGIYPDKSAQVFEDCYRRISNIVELVNPLTIKHAEQNVESRGQLSSNFKPDTAFIMMWMDPNHPELEDVHNTIKRCFKEFGINAERADDIEHDGLITKEILEKIASSELILRGHAKASITKLALPTLFEKGFYYIENLEKKFIST